MKMEQSFFADICEHPDEDAPRLIYADWLDDHDDHDRAEFIRAQIDLARLDEYDDRRPGLVRRERELWVRHRKKWSKPAEKFTKRIEFRRGFVSKMTLTAEKFLKEAEKLFANQPVRALRLPRLAKQFDAVADSPYLSRLRELDLHGMRLGMKRVTRLVNLPRLAGLESLNLGATLMLQGGARAVFSSPHFAGLKTLAMGNLNLGLTDAIERLAESRTLPSLTHLSLQSNNLRSEACGVLAGFEGLGQLESLDLSYNLLGNDGVRRLLEPKTLTRLRKLDLSSTGLDAAGLAVVASCPELAALVELRVGNQSCFKGQGARALAETAYLRNLRVLDLHYGAMLEDDDTVALFRAPFVPTLRVLHVPALSARGLRECFGTLALAGLWNLTIYSHQAVAARLAEELANATHLTRLTHLELQRCKPGAEGITRLANAPHLSGLVFLGLAYNNLGPESLRALIDSPYLPHYCKVDLRDVPSTTDTMREALEERFADVILHN